MLKTQAALRKPFTEDVHDHRLINASGPDCDLFLLESPSEQYFAVPPLILAFQTPQSSPLSTLYPVVCLFEVIVFLLVNFLHINCLPPSLHAIFRSPGKTCSLHCCFLLCTSFSACTSGLLPSIPEQVRGIDVQFPCGIFEPIISPSYGSPRTRFMLNRHLTTNHVQSSCTRQCKVVQLIQVKR